MRKVHVFTMDTEFDEKFRLFQEQLSKSEKIVHTTVENGKYVVTVEQASVYGKKLLLERKD